VIVVVAVLLLLLLLQMLQQSQAAHAAVAFHRRRRRHRRYDIHIRQAGRVTLQGMRKRGKGSEYQAVDKGEIALNQYGHEQLPADVTPQRAFKKD